MEKFKKVLRIVGNVLLYLVIIFAFFVVIVTISSKKNSDSSTTIFNHQLRVVLSDSMAKCEETDVSQYKIKSIPVKSCIFVKVAPENEAEKEEWYSKLKVGDVLTFKYVYTRQVTITHRIVDIKAKADGGYIITLEGDNKASDSETLKQVIDTSLEDSPNYVIGKVTGQSYLLGLIIYILSSKIGLICVIIIPCLIIILLQIFKIVKVVNKEKHEKQNNEIEELKKKLAMYEKENSEDQN